MAYEIKIETGHTMRLDTMQLVDTHTGHLYFREADGMLKLAARTSGWIIAHNSEKRARAAAMGLKRRYESYYKRTGNRFEVEQEEKRKAEGERIKLAREAKARLNGAAPDLLESLQDLLQEMESFAEDCAFSPAKIAKAKAAIAKALGDEGR